MWVLLALFELQSDGNILDHLTILCHDLRFALQDDSIVAQYASGLAGAIELLRQSWNGTLQGPVEGG